MTTKVTARVGRGDTASPSVSVDYEFGEDIKAAVGIFGEKVVFSHFLSSAVISLQSRMRAAISADVDAGKKPDGKKVATALKDWKLGERTAGASKLEKAQKFVSQMSDEEKAALLKQLQDG